jgi:antitoxin (DNA-binding transcriptional repressor) of toxin-antitoxin stability system
MKTITVRDLRQRWPRAEAMLGREKEITVTRDGKPVAKLVRVREVETARKRFDPRRHARWQAKVSGQRTVQWVEEFLIADRPQAPRRWRLNFPPPKTAPMVTATSSGADDAQSGCARCGREGKVMGRHGQREAFSLLPRESGRQVDRIQRPQLRRQRMGRPGQDCAGRLDELDRFEQPEHGFPAYCQIRIWDALPQAQSVERAQALHLDEGAGNPALYRPPLRERPRLPEHEPKQH